MTDKEKIIIDGVNVSQCEFYIYYSSDRYPHRCGIHKDMFGIPACCDVADCCKNCYFKQLKHKEQECEELKEKYEEIKEDRYNLNMEMYTLDRYRKALEEIEEYVQSQLDGFGNDVYLMHKVAINKILNIINKAKDGE